MRELIDHPIELARSIRHAGLAMSEQVHARAVAALLDEARKLLERTHVSARDYPLDVGGFDARRARREFHRLASEPLPDIDELCDLVDDLTCTAVAMRSKAWG